MCHVNESLVDTFPLVCRTHVYKAPVRDILRCDFAKGNGKH